MAATALGSGMMIFASQSEAGTSGAAAADVTVRPMFTMVPPVAPAVKFTVTGQAGGVALVEWTEAEAPDGVTWTRYYVTVYDDTPPRAKPGTGSSPSPTPEVPATPLTYQELPATARSARFNGLDPNHDYSFRVTASGPQGQSAIASATLRRTTLGLSAASINYGASLTYSGTGPRAGDPITIERRAAGTPTWFKVTTVKTGTNLRWSLRTTPSVTTAYRATFAGSKGHWPAASTSTVTVRFAVSIKASTTKPKVNQKITVSGTVRPAQAGAKVNLQRYTGGKWGTVAVNTVKANGSYAIPKTIGKGTWALRVVATGGTNIAYGGSGQVTVIAR
ncbi:fibronectin type III domain-containing protein [Paractinoplanes maris]|uniref:fibronectin type III domain-containing protein n=1 Tax=Paractinoplanes maris TaxID=1734446 RepID=UPI002022837D|nr:fibronectin type III domain-containing protein [Actinoplanes maris]